VRAVARRVGHRVGRRGAILALKGTMALLYGYSQLVEPMANTVSIRLLLLGLPQHGWAWLWMTAGLLALVSVPLRQGRDWLGFAALYLVAAAWATSGLASWWLYDNPRGWITALIWAAYGGVTMIVAAWSEPAARESGADER
jgi:uncharacterized membrane protein YeaQ/YmgE (transglycosylase-associated protein family)